MHMLKICCPAIFNPLALIFKQCVDTGVLPSEWKKVIYSLFKKRRQNNFEKLMSSIVTPYLWKHSCNLSCQMSLVLN